VQFRDFAADFFFVDTNVIDTGNSDENPDHNICSASHNLAANSTSCGVAGPQSHASCPEFFATLISEQRPWLEVRMALSTAEWQIVVTHFPPSYGPTITEWFRELSSKYGIDLIITGHVHKQEVHYQDGPFGDTAWIVSGGGGGITSEAPPSLDGQDDQYGFMDIAISKDRLLIEAHSHGGINGDRVVRSATEVRPRPRAHARAKAEETSVPQPTVWSHQRNPW
jgi:hypothetical protein